MVTLRHTARLAARILECETPEQLCCRLQEKEPVNEHLHTSKMLIERTRPAGLTALLGFSSRVSLYMRTL